MGSVRRRLGFGVTALAMAVVAGLSSLPATAQTAVAAATVTAQVPLTVWDTPSPMQFDGMSTWMATFDSPTAGTGQGTPFYTYFHEFGFNDGGEDYGHLSLDIVNGEKFATLSIVDVQDARESRVRVLFPWTGNSYYFLWVNRVADGVWGAWVYDNNAAAWTTIGAVLVSTRLAKLGSMSATGIAWTGPDLETCTAYPKAVVTRRAPVGYVGTTSVQTQLVTRNTDTGDCPSTVAAFVTGWDYYVVGSDPPVGVTASRAFSTRSTGTEHRYLPRP